MIKIKCLQCGRETAPGEDVCVQCGSRDRQLYVEDKLNVSVRMRCRQDGFLVLDIKHRDKLSKRGRPARERLEINRADPGVTVKKHTVEEQLDDGTWVECHCESQEYPAKRRPSPGKGKTREDRK